MELGDIASIRLSDANNIGGFILSSHRDVVSSFVEDYINAIKELTEKMLAQLGIPQTFVNGLFPKYMTSEGAYV